MKVFANLVECRSQDLAIGMELELVQAPDGTDIVLFRPKSGVTEGTGDA
jgi:hypothetical protein